MNRVLFVLYLAIIAIGRADTIHLKNRGSEINGTVTYATGGFEIEAQFKKATRRIAVARDEVSEVRFNTTRDNPDDDAPGWMLQLPKASGARPVQDTIKFWDDKKTDVSGTLEAITATSITVQGQQSFKRTEVRSVILQ